MENLLTDYQIITKPISESMFIAGDKSGNIRFITKYSFSNNFINTDTIRILKKIQHKNILTPLDVLINSDFIYIVYPYFERNLENYMRANEFLTEEEVKDVMMQLIAGYRTLTSHNIVHGNIKLRNILLAPSGRMTIKLTNFSIVRQKIDNDEYMAPELISSRIAPSTSSDIWSIGVVMKHLLGDHDLKKSYSESCLDFMKGCLQADPSKRYTFKELLTHPFIDSTSASQEHSIDNCSCKKRRDVILSCGDSFCIRCISQLRQESNLSLQDKFVKILDKTKDEFDLYNFDNIMIRCPDCLSFAEISKFYTKVLESIQLHCGCIIKNNIDLDKYISNSNLGTEGN